MLRLIRNHADDTYEPRSRRYGRQQPIMNLEPVEPEFVAPLEVSSPHAPSAVFRIGPTLTQIMGFGPTGQVAEWIRDAMVVPAIVITPDAFDEAAAVATATFDPRREIELQLDQLETRAEWIERQINAIDNGEEIVGADTATAAEAMALALEWERALAKRHSSVLTGSVDVAPTIVASAPDRPSFVDPIPVAGDRVVLAHTEVDAAKVALNSTKRADRKAAQQRLDSARAAEAQALRAAGVATYTEYLMSVQANATAAHAAPPVPPAPLAVTGADTTVDGAPNNAVLIALRARAAVVLGRLPGSDAISELRDHAQRCLSTQTTRAVDVDPGARDALIAELDVIDAQGQVLADSLAGPFTSSEPSMQSVLDVLFSTECETVIVDGDLLWACSYDAREAVLNRLRDVALERRVVLVSDETVLDSFVDSIPHAMLWSSGHLHLLHQDRADWSDDPAVRGATIVASHTVVDHIGVCVNHAGSATRLACPRCHKPFCSLCLIIVDKRAVECVACALGRGGVRARRWRS